MMNRTRLLTFAVIALFLINILTLSFLFFNKGPRPNDRNKQKPREIIIKKLNFDESQISSFDKLIKNHESAIDLLDLEIRNTKNNLYNQLSKNNNEKEVDSILNTLNKYKAEIELVHYNHFSDIKKLCKTDQLDNYNQLTKELAKIFAPKGIHKKDE